MNIWLILLFLQTLILPELSLPLWINKVHLTWWKASSLVFILSLPVLIAVFWPQHAIKIFSKKKRQKINDFLQKIISLLKLWEDKVFRELRGGVEYFFENADKSSERKDYAVSYLLLFIGTLLFLFVLTIDFFKLRIKKAKNWFDSGHKKLYKRLSIAFQGLGYLGVIIGASVPYVPGVRQAGIATVIIMKKRQAKVLFIFVELVRLFVEGYLWQSKI